VIEKKTIEISTEFIKLDQFLKFAGIAQTGGHAKEMVAQGDVLVNGVSCLQRGKKLFPGDQVKVDGIQFEIQSR
jgi:ribosome-associated protein